MKQFIILIAILAFILLSCRHAKKLQRVKTSDKIDIASSHVAAVNIIDSSSITAAYGISVKKEAWHNNVAIKENTADVKLEGYTITSKFAIDTSAVGDTIRLLSQDDDRSNVSIFYDKKTKQVIAEIKSKERIIKVPFREVLISNSSKADNLEANNAHNHRAYLALNKRDSSTYLLAEKSIQKGVSKDIKKRTMPFWAWACIVFVIVAAAIYLYVNRVNVFGRIINKIK